MLGSLPLIDEVGMSPLRDTHPWTGSKSGSWNYQRLAPIENRKTAASSGLCSWSCHGCSRNSQCWEYFDVLDEMKELSPEEELAVVLCQLTAGSSSVIPVEAGHRIAVF